MGIFRESFEKKGEKMRRVIDKIIGKATVKEFEFMFCDESQSSDYLWRAIW